MKLSAQLKENSGYQWVLTQLEPATPFGRTSIRSPRWYAPGEELELQQELTQISTAFTLLVEDPCLCEELTHQLSKFRDIRNSLQDIHRSPMDEVELFEIKHFLLTLEQLTQLCQKLTLDTAQAIQPKTELLALLDPSGRRLPPFSIENAFDPALGRIRAEKAQLEQELHHADSATRIALFTRRQALVQEEDSAELAARRRLTAALLRHRDELLQTMETIGHLDLILAKAKLARRFACSCPHVTSVSKIQVEDMIHPQVAHKLREQNTNFTPISLTLETGSTVITGANMGGKSITLKSITLNLLLLHTGFFVFARSMTAPLFHSVHLICADGQSVEQGLSSFGSEVTTLNTILQTERNHFFFLALDEFARGTNPQEGAILARTLTQYLNHPDLHCVALLTTHYDGVSIAARRHYQVAGLAHCSALPVENALELLPQLMDYHLVDVPPDAPCPHDALRVCHLLGLNPELMAMLSNEIPNESKNPEGQ